MPLTTWCVRCRIVRYESIAKRWRWDMPVFTPASCVTVKTAAARYGLSAVDILVELGKRRMVGGQEDMIVDVALDLRNNK